MKKVCQIKDVRTRRPRAGRNGWWEREGRWCCRCWRCWATEAGGSTRVLQVVGRGVVEALLKLSAQGVAGPKQPG